jgi:hypothetical protein
MKDDVVSEPMKTRRMWCAERGISDEAYYKLRKQGRAPKMIVIGNREFVTRQAEIDWERARLNPPPEEAQMLKSAAEKRRRTALRAAAASLRSPRHIANRRRAGEKV